MSLGGAASASKIPCLLGGTTSANYFGRLYNSEWKESLGGATSKSEMKLGGDTSTKKMNFRGATSTSEINFGSATSASDFGSGKRV